MGRTRCWQPWEIGDESLSRRRGEKSRETELAVRTYPMEQATLRLLGGGFF